MAVAITNTPGARSIADGSTTTTNLTITATGIVSTYYYRNYIMCTGNATYSSIGFQGIGSSWNGSVSTSNSAILTTLDGATALTWYFQIREYTTATAFNNGTPYTTINGSTAALTITARHTASSVGAFNLNSPAAVTCSWTEPSSHALWRARVYMYIEISGNNLLPNNTNYIRIANTIVGDAASPGTITLTADEINMVRNFDTRFAHDTYGGVNLYTITYTGWNLNGTVTYSTDFRKARNNTVMTHWNVPQRIAGSGLTAGRYSNIKYYNGTGFVFPSQAKVYNGTTWVDYGTSTDVTKTNEIRTWNGTAWVRGTRNGEYPTMNTSSQVLPKPTTYVYAEDCALYTGTQYLLIVDETSGTNYISEALDTTNTNYWLSAKTANSGAIDTLFIMWSPVGAMWINSLTFKTAVTDDCPKLIDVRFQKADDKTWCKADGTAVAAPAFTPAAWAAGTYSSYSATPGAVGSFGTNFFAGAPVKLPYGVCGMAIRFLNNTTYITGGGPAAIAEISLELGTITNSTTWS